MADLPREDRADERLSILPLKTHRIMLVLLALALVGMDLARLTGLWPCDIACQGGAHYQTLFGMSVVWPALLGHVSLTYLVWRDAWRNRSNLWTVRLILFLVGVSVFFLLIAHRLELSCTYCQLVHTFTGVAFFLSIPVATRPGEGLALPFAGWLIMNALFHYTPVADVAPGTSIAAHPRVVPNDITTKADFGRTYGDAAAPRTLDIVIDLTCRHCAEQYLPLMEALKPSIASKRVRVVIRHLVRPSQAASTPAAELVLAAATLGEHAAAIEVLLGSNPDSGAAGLQARLADVIDPAKLANVMATGRTSIGQVLSDDQQRIRELGAGLRTPAAVLSENGKVTKQWSGNLPVTAIVSALDGAL